MRARALFSLVGALIAAIALVSASGAATTKAQKVAKIDVSTRAAVIHYLRSVHVNPKGVVIQRGLRNYAGAHCPGKNWVCTRTRHPVVQVAKAGGSNTFSCATRKCTVLQVAKAPAVVTNTAKCVRTSGLIQLCAIIQLSSSANNRAVVYEQAIGSSGLLQAAASNASIFQRAASGKNEACVAQTITLTGSKTVSSGGLNSLLAAYQNVTIRQDSASGGNRADESATSAGGCTGSAVTQSQTLTSKANAPGSITQSENSASLGANMSIDVEQNQSNGFLGTATGANSVNFQQDNVLTAIANSAHGPVNQTQSSATGGLLGTVNQDSRDASTIVAVQHETQCEDAATSGLTTCQTAPGNADFNGTYALHQTQFGPEGISKSVSHNGRRVGFSVHKGVGTAKQTGNGADTFSLTQSSKQDSDSSSGQTNDVQGDCNTSGNCNITQNTTVDGSSTTNTQSGNDLNSGINCTGSSCQPTVPPAPSIDSKPSDPSNSSSAHFEFSDTQAGVSFLCSLDNSGYTPCSSPTDYSNLSDGQHTFSVEAKDGNGNVGPAASYTWTITPAQFTWDGPQLTATNVDVGEFGYGGMRDSGTGTIDVTNVSGTVLRAYLYWNGPTNSTDPGSNANVTFNGTAVPGANIGTASDNNWSYLNSQSYRADVTSLVTGDGSYSLSGFTHTNANVNGAALIVFYDDGNSSNYRNVVLWNGNDSNVTPGPPYNVDGWDEALTGVPYPGSGSASLDLVVSDGQSTFDDAALVVNGTTVVPAGAIFSGNSTPANSTQSLTDGGSLWDIKSFGIAPLLSPGPNSVEVTTGVNGDYLSLVVAIANVPAATP